MVLSEMVATELPDWHAIEESFVDRDTTDFEPIALVIPVKANREKLQALDAEVSQVAAVLREQLAECGFATVDKEDTADGDEVGDNPETVLFGDLDMMVDEDERPACSMHVAVLIDCSLSNKQKNATSAEGVKFERGRRFALTLDRALCNLNGASSRFFGFTDEVIFDCGSAGEGRVSGLNANGGGNNDAAAISFIANETAAHSNKQINVLVMISDGQPANCSWGALRHQVNRLEQQSFVVIQVAVDKIVNPTINNNIDLLDKSLIATAMEFAAIIRSHAAR
jgi:hypothetical protein